MLCNAVVLRWSNLFSAGYLPNQSIIRFTRCIGLNVYILLFNISVNLTFNNLKTSKANCIEVETEDNRKQSTVCCQLPDRYY